MGGWVVPSPPKISAGCKENGPPTTAQAIQTFCFAATIPSNHCPPSNIFTDTVRTTQAACEPYGGVYVAAAGPHQAARRRRTPVG